MSAYEPGTVAVATVRGVPGVRVFRLRKAWSTSRPIGTAVSEAIYDASGEVTDVRPLVVLDLKALIDDGGFLPHAGMGSRQANLASALGDLLREGYGTPGGRRLAGLIADQIEAQTRPPRPAEPTGRWAVVEGREGNRWVRDDGSRDLPWRHIGPVNRSTAWRHITDHYGPVEVLSEGVA